MSTPLPTREDVLQRCPESLPRLVERLQAAGWRIRGTWHAEPDLSIEWIEVCAWRPRRQRPEVEILLWGCSGDPLELQSVRWGREDLTPGGLQAALTRAQELAREAREVRS